MKIPTRRLFISGALASPFLGRVADAKPFDIGDQSALTAALAAAPGPLAIDLWAIWCEPCRRFAPVFDRVASSGEFGDLQFARLDVGPTSGALWQSVRKDYQISFIPAVILFAKGGRWVGTATGGVSTWYASDLKKWLGSHVGAARTA